MHRRRLLALPFTLAVLGCSSCGSTASPTVPFASQSAAQQLQTARAAAMGAGSVRAQVRSTWSTGSAQQSSAGNRTIGHQHNAFDGSVFDLRVLPQVVYFRGNAAATHTQLGLPGTFYAGHWLAIRQGHAHYATLLAGILLPSILDENLPSAPLTKAGGATVAGQRCTLVQGGAPAGTAVAGTTTTISLCISVRAPHLPLKSTTIETSAFGVVTSTVTTFTDYGAAVQVTAPPHPIELGGASA